MQLTKYHALGNDYLVLDSGDYPEAPSPERVERICHRNFGLGSDGILYGPEPAKDGAFSLRIFNPDGSEAEKSGNGIRIFCRYLQDTGRVGKGSFALETLGGRVTCEILGDGRIRVEMGRVSFSSEKIPVAGPPREVLNEEIELDGARYRYCAATIGNPHCVLPMAEVSESLARRLGPLIETRTNLFPNRTNVQFLEVLDRKTIRIEIWERGAGYTLASGSSSSAAAAVAKRLGLVDGEVEVLMPGGKLSISIAEDFGITMTGPVTRIGEMGIDDEALAGI